MVHHIYRRNRSSNRKSYVILFLILIVGFEQLNGLPTNEFVEKCEQRCKDQVSPARQEVSRVQIKWPIKGGE